MTNQEEHINFEEMCKQSEQSHRRGKIFGGILVVIAGSLFLGRELGAEIPQWIFSWKTFLIAIGLLIGVKHNFRHAGWFFLVAIGVVFILGDVYPAMNIKPFIWPVLIILFGLMIIFKPRNKFKRRHWNKFQKGRHGRHGFNKSGNECYTSETTSEEDTVDFTTFMGSVKKNILSKNFKGGEITNVFGGSEINLSQADIETKATLELVNVFGGTRLIIPANWEIHSELVSVFGNIEDKRPVQPTMNGDAAKVLVLKGNTFMGGIEIKSY